LRFEPQLEIKLSRDWGLTAIGRVRGDAFDNLERGIPSQAEISRWSRRVFIGDRADVELRELYLKATVGRTFLTLGKQQIVWGKVDGLKVLDVVNPQDFREFILEDFGESRIPLWAVNVEVPVDKVVMQLLWIPDRTYHKLPEPGSTFSFTSPMLTPTPPPGVMLNLRPLERPRRFFADSDAGIRLSAFWKGWDLTANYLYHYDDFPVPFRVISISASGPQVTITSRYKRAHLIGGTCSNAFGNFVVRGEAGLFMGRFFATRDLTDADGVLKKNELSYVVGVDWSGLNRTLVSVQLFQNWIAGDAPGLIRDKLDTNASLLLRRDFMNNTLVAEAMLVQNVDRGDGMVRPKLSYDLRDNVKLKLGADIFYGGRNGFFGQFNQKSRIVFGIEWGF
jgi:hypothetical protein